MTFWQIFLPCFAALWAICSICAVPIALELAEKTKTKFNYALAFCSTVILGPISIGACIDPFN